MVSYRTVLMLVPCLAILTIFLIVPFMIVAVMSFSISKPGGWELAFTISNYMDIFASSAYVHVMLFTIRLSLVVTAICLVAGLPVAFYIAFTVRSATMRIMLFLIMLIPSWIDWTTRAVAWLPILGIKGMSNNMLVGLGLLDKPSPLFLFSEFSTTLVMVQTYLLFMIAPIVLAMTKFNPVLLEQAAVLGAGKWRSFYEVTLKLSLPGIVVGCLFIFVMSMADFATPRVLGGVIQTMGLTVYNFVSVYDWPMASAFGTILTLITLAGIFVLLRVADIKSMTY